MKKIASLFVLAALFLPGLRGQDPTFEMGDKVFSAGIGLGTTYYRGLGYSMGVPPVSVSLEVAIADEILEEGVIGVGGYAGYSSSRWRSTWLGGEYGWNYSNIILGGLGTFHYPLVDNLDTYAGILGGFRIQTSREVGDVGLFESPASGGIVFSGFIGGRYYVSDNLSIFAQIGYGIAYLTLGVSVKL